MTVIDSAHLLLERLALHNLLATMRGHDQYNTTPCSRPDRYRGVSRSFSTFGSRHRRGAPSQYSQAVDGGALLD
ncbi:hypothetical protein [Paraburkholderia sp. GAS348]|uniref:hypothetical protein n=1 Tax=Paraburkholderia sp. GAS348 TaxID=3035132 RepID=UPI003D22D97D